MLRCAAPRGDRADDSDDAISNATGHVRRGTHLAVVDRISVHLHLPIQPQLGLPVGRGEGVRSRDGLWVREAERAGQQGSRADVGTPIGDQRRDGRAPGQCTNASIQTIRLRSTRTGLVMTAVDWSSVQSSPLWSICDDRLA